MDLDVLDSCFLTAVLDNLPDLGRSLSPASLDTPFATTTTLWPPPPPPHPSSPTLMAYHAGRADGAPPPTAAAAEEGAQALPLSPPSGDFSFACGGAADESAGGTWQAATHVQPSSEAKSESVGPPLSRRRRRNSEPLYKKLLATRPGSGGCGSEEDVSAACTASAKTPPLLPPCRVCGGRASGFHYGVNTCKACKGFFHRCLHRKSVFQCAKSGNCIISEEVKSSCPACRYQRCLSAGMTREAAKIGRYTHSKRTQDTLEIKRLQCSIFYPDDSEPLKLAGCVAEAFETFFAEIAIFHTDPDRIQAMKNELLGWHSSASSTDHIMFGDADEQSLLNRYMASVPASSADGDWHGGVECDVTQSSWRSRAIQFLKMWAEKVDTFIRAIVNFAKCIPGFKSLPMSDQIILVKEARAEIQCLLNYRRVDNSLNCLWNYNLAKNALVLTPIKLLKVLCFDEEFFTIVTTNLNRLDGCNLSVTEVALLASIILASPDREHLSSHRQVEEMQEKLVRALLCSVRSWYTNREAAVVTKVFANALLVLPVLRTCSSRVHRHVEEWRKSFPLEFSPLVQECLETSGQNETTR